MGQAVLVGSASGRQSRPLAVVRPVDGAGARELSGVRRAAALPVPGHPGADGTAAEVGWSRSSARSSTEAGARPGSVGIPCGAPAVGRPLRPNVAVVRPLYGTTSPPCRPGPSVAAAVLDDRGRRVVETLGPRPRLRGASDGHGAVTDAQSRRARGRRCGRLTLLRGGRSRRSSSQERPMTAREVVVSGPGSPCRPSPAARWPRARSARACVRGSRRRRRARGAGRSPTTPRRP